MMTTARVLLVITLTLSITSPSTAAIDKSDNISLVQHVPYKNAIDESSGGSELAAAGDILYSAQLGNKGGLHVFDISGTKARRLSFTPCSGTHADVEVVRRNLVALSFEMGLCAGVRFYDVSDPSKPRLRSSVSVTPHTITAYPGRPIVYVSGGGARRANGTEFIIDVSDPKKPEIVDGFAPNPLGCHDLDFYVAREEQLAVCVGGGEGTVWDVSDPFLPIVIGHIPVVGMLPHSVGISPDGRYIAIGDETIAECSTPLGAMQLYDFSVRQAPVLLSHYDTPYDSLGEIVYCSPNFRWMGKDLLLTTWNRAGMMVFDTSDPRSPTEVARYVGDNESVTNYWGLEYARGRIWVNDRTRGLDVLRLTR